MELSAKFFVDGYDDEFLVTFDYEPYVAAKISGPPENCRPAEGGEVEVTSIVLVIGGEQSGELLGMLSQREINRLGSKAGTWAREQQSSGDL